MAEDSTNNPNVPNTPHSQGAPNSAGTPNKPLIINTKDSPSTTATQPPAPAPPPPKPRARHDEQPRKSHTWIWIIVILLLLGGGYYIYSGYKKADEDAQAKAKQPRPGVPIMTTSARKGDIGVYINALGTVTPVYTATITSRVDGQITNVSYREGQMVHKGDLLLEIDPRPYQAALTQAEGTLARDEALLGEAKIDLDRYQQAYNKNAIAKQQLDDQQQAVKQDEGTVKTDQGTVASAATNVDYTHIKAPIDGRVGLRLVDPGNIVTSGATTPLVVVTQLQPITVIFSVAQGYLPQIQKQMRNGQKMAVDALASDDKTKIASGSLLTLDNQIDTTTGTLKLKAIFPNNDASLFPNQFVNSRLLVDTEHDVTLIPTAAIQRNAQGAFVYVIQSDQTASLRNITVGTTDRDTVAVQGVQPDEVIAVNGFDKLQNGAKVIINNNSGNGQNGGNNHNQGGNGGATGNAGSNGKKNTGGGTHP